nr:MAG TPA: hypothetical protein [Caudoviricetes sp.]
MCVVQAVVECILAVFGLVFMPEMPPEMGKEQER